MSESLFSKVLLVVDSADTSLAAAEFAVKLARETGCEINALAIVDTIMIEYLTLRHVLVADEVAEFDRELLSTAERYLAYVGEMAKVRGVRFQTRVQKGSFHQLALQAARELPADAILMGGWSSSATQHDTLAASHQLILEEAACPVIVIRSRS